MDWSFLFNFNYIDVALHEFYSRLCTLFDEHVPLYKSFKHKYPYWYNFEIINNIKMKAKSFVKYKKTGINSYLEQFKRQKLNKKTNES